MYKYWRSFKTFSSFIMTLCTSWEQSKEADKDQESTQSNTTLDQWPAADARHHMEKGQKRKKT